MFFFVFYSYGDHLDLHSFPTRRSSDLISGMALLILALLQRIFLMSSLMLLLVWLIFFMVLININHTRSSISEDRKSGSAGMPRPISYAVFCLKKKKRKN